MNKDNGDSRLGMISAFFSYLIWGFLPIYWKQIKQVPALEIIMNRILWSFLLALVILIAAGNRNFLKPLKKRSTLIVTMACSALIFVNWTIYVYGVNSGQLVECSMGYYISPLVSVFLGLVLLKETLSKIQKIALILVTAGVILMGIQYGRFPWISISLGFTFGFYGYLKKKTRMESLPGLAAETLFTLPLALLYLLVKGFKGELHFLTDGIYTQFFLLGAGAMTLLPLFLFAYGSRRIPLSMMGFLLYLSPTIMLLTGVFLYGEIFPVKNLFSFLLIWSALGLYSVSLVKSGKKVLREPEFPHLDPEL